MKHSIETITPKKAMEWLKRNIHNRPLSKKHVSFIAGLLREGKFELNGDAIRFNANGDLIDGQHRLMACIESGVSFQSLVIRGLPHSTFATFDGGRPRTAADDLHGLGERNCQVVSAACRAAYLLTNHEVYNETTKVRRDQIASYLQSNPDIRDSIAYANVNQTGVMGRAIVASLHFLFIRKDESLASVFWERVLKGEGLSSSMAEYKLREQVTRKRSAVGGRLRSPFVYGLTIKAWNARRDGTAVKTLKYDPSNEAFPKIK